MTRYLSKSDFILARDCPRKLFYKKRGYPSNLEDNEYLQYLADGGFMVERIAQLLYPDGQELDFDLRDPEGAAAATRTWMAETQTGTLFEAVVIADNLMARVDVLHKEGDRIDLIEVKSTSINSDESPGFRGKRGEIASDKRKYVEDVAFQTQVIRDAYPKYRVTPFLCVADKAKHVTEACTLGQFTLERPDASSASGRTVVLYHGDVAELRETHPLVVVDVSELVDQLADQIREASGRFAAAVSGDELVALPGPLTPGCRECEYRITKGASGDQRDGFAECWGDLAREADHIVDLYYASSYGGGAFDELVQSGSVDIKRLDTSVCKGARGARQRLQIEYSRSGEEHKPAELTELLRGHVYPLHFIDFEAAQPVIPFHAGMRPYDRVAFQWSCHTIREPGAACEHSEWLNIERALPNVEFVRSLREAIGTTGTVYVWTSYESTTLASIRAQMDAYSLGTGHADREAIVKWLDEMDAGRGTRIVDLNKLALDYYFHPIMKGRTSIKVVLPAVLAANPGVLDRPEREKYRSLAPDGSLQSPYASLPELTLPDGTVMDAVREGTGAMRAYGEMLFGVYAGITEYRNALRDLLLQYCELDTAAMVMIWDHWVG